MSGTTCGASVQACRLRVARLDPSGVPLPGGTNLYVSDALVRLEYTPEVAEGQDFEQRNGCGTVCVSYKAPDSIKRWNIVIVVCTQDPELEELLGGGDILTLGNDTVGHKAQAIGAGLDEDGVSLEAWAKHIVSGDIHATRPYIRYVMPKVYNRRQNGTRTLENGVQVPEFTGVAVENTNWFDGPANDWYTIADEDADRAVQRAYDTALPAATCGYQTLAAS